ncbi:DUF2752 domain-containing protein [Flavobacterium chuncheonense]|uniref:DUF2752 domain-containing protein n=1 Tax=Flavobacterium chuncheonense TaxID=2026653 RepID=A0ABW5YJY3_9FLAO
MYERNSFMEEFMLPCLNKKLFGIECPGCGTQRSIILLLEGDFIGAFKMFPAIYTLLLLLVLITLHFTDKSRNYTKAIIGIAILNAIITIIAYVIKMNTIN